MWEKTLAFFYNNRNHFRLSVRQERLYYMARVYLRRHPAASTRIIRISVAAGQERGFVHRIISRTKRWIIMQIYHTNDTTRHTECRRVRVSNASRAHVLADFVINALQPQRTCLKRI